MCDQGVPSSLDGGTWRAGRGPERQERFQGREKQSLEVGLVQTCEWRRSWGRASEACSRTGLERGDAVGGVLPRVWAACPGQGLSSGATGREAASPPPGARLSGVTAFGVAYGCGLP